MKALIQVLVISLQRSTDRREAVKKQLEHFSFPWKFIDAVDGRLLSRMPPSYKAIKVKLLQGYELTPGEIGCFLSHIQAWKLCVEHNRTTLVFEDDFRLTKNIEQIIRDLIDISDQWNLVRLSGIYETPHEVLMYRRGYDLVRNLGEPCGTAAYMIQPEAAEILLKNATHIYEPVDHYLEHYYKHSLRILAAKPYPIQLSHSKSTITDRFDRKSVRGLYKTIRSVLRWVDRVFNPSPWFPKS